MRKTKNDQVTDGTLYCAGMIAGEGLVGIALAILAVAGISLDYPGVANFGNIGGVVLMIIMILTLLKFSLWKKKKSLMKKQNKKSKKKVLDINYLDLIPVRAEELQWFTRTAGTRDSCSSREYRIVQQDCPEGIQQTAVHQGTSGCIRGHFIWPLIDGERTVADIAALVKNEFRVRQQSRFIRGSSNISRSLRAIIFIKICKYAF